MATIRLPAKFKATHDTAGLAGFPSIDNFATPGTSVLAPVSGQLVDEHMIPWNLKERVGGETVYLQGDNGKTYFLTHLAGKVPSGRVEAGQPIGQVSAVPQGAWQSHIHEGVYNGIYNPGTSTTSSNAGASTPGSWPQSATLAYQMGMKAGLTPQQAKDFAAVQYGESGFNPSAVNKSSGAAGLYQLLSSGYVDKANQLGGVMNPKANIQAILPDYVKYYQSHPFQPGAAGAAVERSGEGASYYAQGWQHLPGMPNGTAGATGPQMPPGAGQPYGTPPPAAPVAPQQHQVAAGRASLLGQSLALELTNAAQSMLSGGTPKLSSLFTLAKGYQASRAAVTKAAPLGGTPLAVRAGGVGS